MVAIRMFNFIRLPYLQSLYGFHPLINVVHLIGHVHFYLHKL
jgi:hypothetical protein